MILHCLVYTSESLSTSNLFRAACVELGVEYRDYAVANVVLSELPVLNAHDALYRIALGQKAHTAERMMITPECTTFYARWESAIGARGCSYFIHRNIGLPVIPSIPYLPDTEQDLLAAIEYLGGFPLIVKVRGGSHGVGVMRVDSLQSLRSILDYLRSIQSSILIRKYIAHRYYGRLIVLGDRVVASHITYPPAGEFRTNAGDSTKEVREARVFSEEIQQIAVRAVRSLGIETGGVDLLFDENDHPHIAEVNFPNDFTFTQNVTGINIAQEMVKYLLEKQQRNGKVVI